MKGAQLHILILTVLGLLAAFIMVCLNLYPSWSQYARTMEEPVLFVALSSFSTLFIIRSFSHHQKNMQLTKIGNMSYRLSHNNRITGYLFLCILFTPVTHPLNIIQNLHFLFTGLAILFAYYELLAYYKQGTQAYWGRFVGSMAGIWGFLGGFVFELYSVGVGELLAATPIAIHILFTLKNNSDVPD